MDKPDQIALLIDADNATAARIDVILDELSRHGETNIRRAYGNWTKTGLKSWQEVLHDNAIRPVQQFDPSKGKNASDIALAVDAVEILHTQRPDWFAIASSDADFTPLVMHLREHGAKVYGFGDAKTPQPFQSACTRFLVLNRLAATSPLPDAVAPVAPESAPAAPPRRRASARAATVEGATTDPDFRPGLEGVIAFESEIAEPDKEGGALRYRGVDIKDLVGRVSFGQVWGLLVDNEFDPGLPPAEPFPLPVHSGDIRVDVQSALAQLAPVWGFKPLLDIDDAEARDNLARASVMAMSFIGQSAHGQSSPMVPQSEVDKGRTIVERFMIRWRGEPDPKHVEAIDAYFISAAEHGMNASTFTARVIASTGADAAACLSGAIGALSGRCTAAPRQPGPAHDRGRRADRRRAPLRQGGARPQGAPHGLRAPGLPRRTTRGPRCCATPVSAWAPPATRWPSSSRRPPSPSSPSATPSGAWRPTSTTGPRCCSTSPTSPAR
jgi:uncharacterized protein (TIGR00288 family)